MTVGDLAAALDEISAEWEALDPTVLDSTHHMEAPAVGNEDSIEFWFDADNLDQDLDLREDEDDDVAEDILDGQGTHPPAPARAPPSLVPLSVGAMAPNKPLVPVVGESGLRYDCRQVGASWDALWWAHIPQDHDTAGAVLMETWMDAVTVSYYTEREDLLDDDSGGAITPCMWEIDDTLRRHWLRMRFTDADQLWDGPPFPNSNVMATMAYIGDALNPVRSPFCQPHACPKCDDLREYLDGVESRRLPPPPRVRIVQVQDPIDHSVARLQPVLTCLATITREDGAVETWEHPVFPGSAPGVAPIIVASARKRGKRPNRRKRKASLGALPPPPPAAGASGASG